MSKRVFRNQSGSLIYVLNEATNKIKEYDFKLGYIGVYNPSYQTVEEKVIILKEWAKTGEVVEVQEKESLLIDLAIRERIEVMMIKPKEQNETI